MTDATHTRIERGCRIIEVPNALMEPADPLPGGPRRIEATRLVWSSLREWLILVLVEGGSCRASTPAHARCDRLYRSLTVQDIRATRDVEALEFAASMFDHARHGEVPSGRGLRRCFSRGELGAFLVEIRNRVDAVRSGRADAPARTPGPRFDPRRLPNAALDRLIQSHADMAVVEALRAEKRRRLSAEDGGGDNAAPEPEPAIQDGPPTPTIVTSFDGFTRQGHLDNDRLIMHIMQYVQCA